MAFLTKQGARKPLVEKGAVTTGPFVQWEPSDWPGYMHGTTLIGITVHDVDARKDYRLGMSRGEALHVMAELAAQLRDTEPKVTP